MTKITRMTSIGVDIEQISRFTNLTYEAKQSFYKKIFTENEIQYCLSKSNPYPHFTARFCAKEAAIKALNSKISFLDIEIQMINKKPHIKLPNNKTGIVSMSHTLDYAISMVVIT